MNKSSPTELEILSLPQRVSYRKKESRDGIIVRKPSPSVESSILMKFRSRLRFSDFRESWFSNPQTLEPLEEYRNRWERSEFHSSNVLHYIAKSNQKVSLVMIAKYFERSHNAFCQIFLVFPNWLVVDILYAEIHSARLLWF